MAQALLVGERKRNSIRHHRLTPQPQPRLGQAQAMNPGKLIAQTDHW